jgi:alkanesulfonate monooxygenase SsuD/methylene tetrahydromethanopterin reductase-like flavin-dependent oxidoreductase (luciferase family)
MKVSAFAQVAYRTFPSNFQRDHNSAVDTPWSLADPREVRAAFRDYLDGLMLAARSGFDGLIFTEHAQASYDMSANPSLTAATLAYATESEGLDVAIYPAGRSLGKTREPVRVAEEYAAIDTISGGRLVAGFPVGLPYDACLNNGIAPMELRSRFDENLALILRAWSADQAFAWNGSYSQLPSVNIWPRPQQQPRPPVWLTGIGNPATMQMALDQDFGFNYLSWFGLKTTGPRIFDRFWELTDRQGTPRNPYRLGLSQVVGVAGTDAEAVRMFKPHVEYLFNKGPGAIKSEVLAIPGTIGLPGLQALMRDPTDFGIADKLRTVAFDELVDMGSVIVGSPGTVVDRLLEVLKRFRIGNLHAMLQFGSMPRQLAMENIGLFAKEVIPKIRHVWQGEEKGEKWEHHWWPERLGGRPRDVASTTAAGRSAR